MKENVNKRETESGMGRGAQRETSKDYRIIYIELSSRVDLQEKKVYLMDLGECVSGSG